MKDASLTANHSLDGTIIKTALYSKAGKEAGANKRQAKADMKVRVEKIEEEFNVKVEALRARFMDKLIVLVDGKKSAGISDLYGVEIIPQAIDDAKNNARINDISNAKFYVGKSEEILPQKYREEEISADVIVVDPPRKGCDEALLSTILQIAPKKVVYVSCDSATLARDLKYLCENGYEIRKVRAVDQFGQTVHVECVTLLSQTNI